MPRTNRLTSVLAGRGKAAAAVAAAAAVLAGAGTASAAAISAPAKSADAAPVGAAGVLAAAPHGAGAVLATRGSTTLNPAPQQAAPAKAAALAQPAAPAQPGAAAKPAAPAPAAPAAAPAPAAPAAPAAAPAPAPAPAQPFRVYDSVTPSAIPSGAAVATYADGGYAVNPAQVAGRNVTWIDTNGSDPRAAALDVEPGDATPAMAANWTWHKLHSAANSIAIIYTMRSEWPAAQAAVATLPAPMQSHVRWWIADPTGVPHIVPGSSATQWYWGTNYDITRALPGSGL